MENKLTLKEIGNIYGVSKYTISNIKRKVNWINVTKNYSFPKVEIKRSSNGRFYKSKSI